MHVAILGCGPAGLLAAYAATLEGHHPHIFSLKRKSLLSGAQFIHESIEGLTREEPDALITFRKVGTKRGYARKVYGDPYAPCSWDEFPEGDRAAWSMQDAYDKLWERFEPRIRDERVDGRLLDALEREFMLIISTIPANVLCRERNGTENAQAPTGHRFNGQPVWIADYNYGGLASNTIEYNGEEKIHWHRASSIFGYEATESSRPMSGAHRGIKPLDTDCDCRPAILRAGRFGQWRKGVLIHDAFQQTRTHLRREVSRAV